jgi:hypothetical protein
MPTVQKLTPPPKKKAASLAGLLRSRWMNLMNFLSDFGRTN